MASCGQVNQTLGEKAMSKQEKQQVAKQFCKLFDVINQGSYDRVNDKKLILAIERLSDTVGKVFDGKGR
jgi:hypothetical protein